MGLGNTFCEVASGMLWKERPGQSHETCLWKQQNLDALSAAGFDVLMDFPKSSQPGKERGVFSPRLSSAPSPRLVRALVCA